MDRPGLLSSIPLHRLALESDEHPEALPELYRNAAQALSMKEEELAALVADNMERISARLAAGRRNALPERGWQETAAFFLGGSAAGYHAAWAFFRTNQFSVGNSGLPPSSWDPSRRG